MHQILRSLSELPVAIFGHLGTLVHGDTLVLDRWLWLRRRLPIVNEPLRLLDVGCGSGAFTIGAALRGYDACGLSWDAANQHKASTRAQRVRVASCKFEIHDARRLEAYPRGSFSVIINCENIEHIIDDRKLMCDMADKLLPGGILLLTAPNFFYEAITSSDNGPFCKEETGWHVRRGYMKSMLCELCEHSGLRIEEISYCSGFLSQKVTRMIRLLNPLLGVPLTWFLTMPLRILPPLLDPLIRRFVAFPDYSICLVAQRPRYSPLDNA